MPIIQPASKNILIIAGDVSGDMHAANLIREMKTLMPSLNVTAMGGQRLQAVSDSFLFDLAAKGASGFLKPILKFPL